jgi:hypothetical protein
MKSELHMAKEVVESLAQDWKTRQKQAQGDAQKLAAHDELVAALELCKTALVNEGKPSFLLDTVNAALAKVKPAKEIA